MRRIVAGLSLILLLSTVLLTTIAASAQTTLPQRFAMRAQAKGNVASGATARVQVTIERWSDEAERDRLLGILVESGPEAMKEALQALPQVGRVRVNSQTSYPLQFAREFPNADGSRLIRIVTDRPISALEAMSNSRTSEFAFTLIELSVDAEGKGDGVAAVGVEIAVDAARRTFSLTSYDSAPVRLSNVRPMGNE